jgi:hypothetical protein
MNFPEHDWKILKQVKTAALERVCAGILEELRKASAADGKTDHERYLDVWDLLGRRDQDVAAAFDDYRRSTAFIRLKTLRQSGYLTDEEFSRFSLQTRASVERVMPARKTSASR